MTASRENLAAVAAVITERSDRREARSRHDVELAVLVLEDLADALDGYPAGTTTARFGTPLEEPTVVLLRRFANVHHRLGVADRRCELDATTDLRIEALARTLGAVPTDDGFDVALLDEAGDLAHR